MNTGFKLSGADREPVVRLCQLVEGMPLGLELAASWLRMLTCAEIVAEIERDLDFLSATLQNIPARHRSLRAVFDRSWQMLSEQEQAVFCKLSIFRGGFLREAATQVAGASLSNLIRLVDKSLLRRTATGRYDIHELLRQYAAEKLTGVLSRADQVSVPQPGAPTKPDVWQRHSAYYLKFISQQEPDLRGNTPQQAIAATRQELDNIRQAWQWAVSQAEVATLELSVGGLSRFYDLTGLFQEGETVFGRAIDDLRAHPASREPASAKSIQALIVRLLVERARLLNRRGLSDQAVQIIPEAAELAHTIQDTRLEAIAYHQWGETLSFHGEPRASQVQLEKALRLARKAGVRNIEAEALRHLGIAFRYQGDYIKAKAHYDQALAAFRKIGDHRGENLTLNNLGVEARDRGNYAEAQDYYERALRGFRETNDLWGQGILLNNLGNVMYDQGDYAQAQALCHEGLQFCRKIKDLWGESHLLYSLGNITREQGDFSTSRTHYEQCLHIRREIEAQLHIGNTLAEWALLLHHLEDHRAARDYSLQAEQIGLEVEAPAICGLALTHLGHARLALGEVEAATEAYRQAYDIRQETGEHHRALESLAGLAQATLQLGDLEQARHYTEEILPLLETAALYGTAEPFRVQLICYQVLAAAQDPRAQSVLETAHRLLHERAALLETGEQQRAFLENIPAHREIERAFHGRTVQAE